MRVLVTGAGGMVARAVREFCEGSGDSVFAYDRSQLDIANATDVSLNKETKSLVIGGRAKRNA